MWTHMCRWLVHTCVYPVTHGVTKMGCTLTSPTSVFYGEPCKADTRYGGVSRRLAIWTVISLRWYPKLVSYRNRWVSKESNLKNEVLLRAAARFCRNTYFEQPSFAYHTPTPCCPVSGVTQRDYLVVWSSLPWACVNHSRRLPSWPVPFPDALSLFPTSHL